MGMLGGFLKQMNDSIKYNRALVKKTDKSKSKQIREAFKDEVRNRSSSYENVNLDELKKRVRRKLQRNKTQDYADCSSILILQLKNQPRTQTNQRYSRHLCIRMLAKGIN